jgi:hypothetical protein
MSISGAWQSSVTACDEGVRRNPRKEQGEMTSAKPAGRTVLPQSHFYWTLIGQVEAAFV